MIYQSGKRIEVVAEATPDAFAKQLNSRLAALDKARQKYELQFNHQMGFCAYLVIDQVNEIPETIEDEFELAGEKHTCGDCPFWQHPKDGRVKYTRCEITPGIHGSGSPCCAEFYARLYRGEIELPGKEEER